MDSRQARNRVIYKPPSVFHTILRRTQGEKKKVLPPVLLLLLDILSSSVCRELDKRERNQRESQPTEFWNDDDDDDDTQNKTAISKKSGVTFSHELDGGVNKWYGWAMSIELHSNLFYSIPSLSPVK